MARIEIKKHFPISKEDVKSAFVSWDVEEEPNHGGFVFSISEPREPTDPESCNLKFAEVTLTVKGYIIGGLGDTVWEGTTVQELNKDVEDLADFLDSNDLWPSQHLNESAKTSKIDYMKVLHG